VSASQPRRVILAWALYDFAITIFSMNVISRYFGLWVTETMGGSDLRYSITFAVSMGAAALAMPLIGAWADRTGHAAWYLRAATFTGVDCTAALGVASSLGAGLCLFAVANGAVQIGGFLYDALLPVVSRGRRTGIVSGIGVACGYLGSLTGLIVVQPFVARGGYQAAFLPSAMLLLAAALPCLWLVRGEQTAAATRPARPSLRESVRTLRAHPDWQRFLIASFLCINAINAVIMFMAVYARRLAGLTDPELDRLLLLSTVCALAGAVGAGWLAHRLGACRSLELVFAAWCAALLVAVIAPHRAVLWGLGPLIGVALGATWTIARTVVAALAPPDRAGEFFGMYGMVGRAASNIGPLLWGHIVAAWPGDPAWRDRAAMGSLLLLMAAGWAVFRGVRVAARGIR